MTEINFQNHMEFMHLHKEDLICQYSEKSGIKSSVKDTLDYLIEEYPESTELINKFRRDYIAIELECSILLDKINNCSSNLYKIIKILMSHKVLNVLVPDSEKQHLSLTNTSGSNKFKILNSRYQTVANFFMNYDDIRNKILSEDDIQKTIYFHIGKFLYGKYISYEHNLKKDDASLNSTFYARKICVFNQMFVENHSAVSINHFARIEPVNKNIFEVEDIYSDFIHEDFNLSLDSSFFEYIYRKNNLVWSKIGINEDNYESILKNLTDIHKLFIVYRFKTSFKIIRNYEDDTNELRIYFSHLDTNIGSGNFIILDGQSFDILDKHVYQAESLYNNTVKQTEFTVKNIFSGEFVEYKKLLNY